MREEEAPEVDEEGDGTYNVPGLWNRGGMSGRTQIDDVFLIPCGQFAVACWRGAATRWWFCCLSHGVWCSQQIMHVQFVV